jgi:hypothetical protein
MRLQTLLLGTAALPLLACHRETVAPGATVYFTIDAPLCSMRLPVVFSIDSVQVGTDTFSVHLTPSHVTSSGFPVPAGAHRLSALVPGGYAWPGRVVTLGAGGVFTDSLPFYCS